MTIFVPEVTVSVTRTGMSRAWQPYCVALFLQNGGWEVRKMEERTLATLIQNQDVGDNRDESTTLLDTSEDSAEVAAVAEDAVKRSERRARKLQAKRKTRAVKVAKRSRSVPTDLGLSGKEAKAEWAAMYRHWKRIHEISGAILANLEDFSQQTKQR